MEIRSKFKIKNRSRFTSSIIISLLAGFICFQFGEDIQNEIVCSVKAISSNSLNETYGPEYCESFNSLVNKSDKKIKRVKSGFYIKKKSKTEINSSDNISSENMISEIKKIQAMTRKAKPDKNLDFTNELNRLTDRNSINKLNEKINSKSEIKGLNAIADENCETDKFALNIQIAELKGLSKIEINKNGYGFEFNNTNCESNCNKNRNSVKVSKSYNYKVECGTNFNCAKNSENIEENSCYKVKKVNKKNKINKVQIQTGVHKTIIINKNTEIEDPEILIQDEELEEGNN